MCTCERLADQNGETFGPFFLEVRDKLKIGTNKNWSFSFTKAKRKTVNRAGKEELVYDNNNKIVYEKPLITENIIL